MLMQIGQKPESDFNEPIGMLEDCHKRIIHFLKVLAALSEIEGEKELCSDMRKSLETALRYFRESAPRHTADEEESLFPQLRCKESANIQAVFANIDGLEADHRWADSQHQEIDAIGRRWLLQGTLLDEDRLRMKTILDTMLRFYERHIALEESEVFSAARSLLSALEIEKLGREMAQRRGIVLGKIHSV